MFLATLPADDADASRSAWRTLWEASQPREPALWILKRCRTFALRPRSRDLFFFKPCHEIPLFLFLLRSVKDAFRLTKPTMGISVRKSIGWPPEPHSEPTSTIVLTSPKCWFVDVRVLSPAATDSGHVVDIDWAFAGMSSSTGVRSVWRHWVDSRTENAASVTDEGDCEELPDGNYLEKGEMVNPATGKMAPYEEVWIDVQPVATSPAEVGAMRCVVVQLHDDAAGTRGVVERLGQFCQGIVRTAAKGITVERWQWTAGKGWQRTFRLGTGSIPCQQLVHETRLLEEGDILHDSGHLWTVIETAAVRGGGH